MPDEFGNLTLEEQRAEYERLREEARAEAFREELLRQRDNAVEAPYSEQALRDAVDAETAPAGPNTEQAVRDAAYPNPAVVGISPDQVAPTEPPLAKPQPTPQQPTSLTQAQAGIDAIGQHKDRSLEQLKQQGAYQEKPPEPVNQPGLLDPWSAEELEQTQQRMYTEDLLTLYPELDSETASRIASNPGYRDMAKIFAVDAEAKSFLTNSLLENDAKLSEENAEIAVRQAAFAKENYDELKSRAEQLDRMQVNPNRFFQNASTGRKIGMVLGVILSGLGGNAQQSLDLINAFISRDIDAQKANIGLARKNYGDHVNLYKQGLEMFDDERAASLAVYKRAVSDAQAKAQAMLDTVKDERQAAGLVDFIQKAEMAKQQAQLEQNERLAKIAQDTAKTKAEIAKDYAQTRKLNAEANKLERRGTGKGRLAGTPQDPNAITSPYDRNYTIGTFDKSIPAKEQKEARETLQAATRASYLLNQMEDLMRKGTSVVTAGNTSWIDWLESADGKVLKRLHGQYAKALARAQNGARVSDFDLKFELEAMPIDTLLTRQDQALAVLEAENRQLDEELRWNLNMLPGFDLGGKSVEEVVAHVRKPRDYSGEDTKASRDDLSVYINEGTPAAITKATSLIAAARNSRGSKNSLIAQDATLIKQARDRAQELAKELKGEAAKRQRRNVEILNSALEVKKKQERTTPLSKEQETATEKLRPLRIDRPR